MSRREKYVAGLGVAVMVVRAGLIVAGSILSRRIEPYIRQQAEQYLRTRFHAEVRIASLHVRLPKLSPLRMLFTRGRGTIAIVEGEGIVMRMWGLPNAAPLFGIGKFAPGIDIGALGDSAQHVGVVTLTGLEITIPPKGERPDLGSGKNEAESAGHEAETRTPYLFLYLV